LCLFCDIWKICIMSRKKAPTTSRFLIIWTWQLCTMAIRSLHGLSANFTLTPPCLNRLATALPGGYNKLHQTPLPNAKINSLIYNTYLLVIRALHCWPKSLRCSKHVSL
jgi:hypothetical protein